MSHVEIPDTTLLETGAGLETPQTIGPKDLARYFASIPEYARPFPQLVHKEPIGPQDATDFSKPFLELRGRNVATVAVHNVLHYTRERERFTQDVIDSYMQGSLRLSHEEGSGDVVTQAQAFVEASMQRLIPDVQASELDGALLLDTLRTIEDLKATMSEQQATFETKVNDIKAEAAQKVLALRQLFLARKPSKREIREFDKAAGIATALEEGEETGRFKEIVGHLIGQRAAAILRRDTAPQSIEVDVVKPLINS